MKIKERHDQLHRELVKAIETFEEDTGCRVSDLKLHRSGSPDSYRIYGIGIPIVPFEDKPCKS